MKHLKYIFIGCLALLWGCQQEDPWQGTNDLLEGDGLQLRIQTEGLMDQFTVNSRGDIKEPEEQEIKSLHVFIFDEEGNYLATADEHRYQGYRSITGGKNVMNIDREGWKEPEKAQNATVIVVANVEPSTFQSATADTPPTNIPNRDALVNFVYRPLTERAVTSLPESGMPMYARMDKVDLTSGNTNQSIDIAMKALMTRVDVTFVINSTNTDVTGNLPQLTVDECKVLNAPKATPFTENIAAETDLSAQGMGKENYTLSNTSAKTIYNRKGELNYTFYTFENLQEPANPDYVYPDGIKDDEKQRYKPELADKENSMAFELSGHYMTYNGASYDVTYTLYLGANHTNDFKVMRNKQYKNNVTIQGIVNVGNNEEHITFDTRVNVSASNPYFVSMLKDRTMDSHFNVVPMDIYFFNNNPSNPNSPKQTMKVEIVDPETNDWVRMEKIPSADMEAGTAPSVSDGPDLLTFPNKAWHAGNGKRRYFTTDLVTKTLAGNTSIEIDASRDRIYFYVDENLQAWNLTDDPNDRTRTATIKLTYYEDGVEKGTREVMIEQAKLLQVTFHAPDEEGGEDEDRFENKTIYIEMYEEYLSHGDPLDEFDDEQVYTGLPWGADGREIGSYHEDDGSWFGQNIDSWRNYYWGHAFTSIIVNNPETEYSMADLTLNTKPKTAAGYCYIKNKRNADGSVPNHKWYLPGIRELERILEDYYIEYPEFQNNYYWASAAGEHYLYSIFERPVFEENQARARATKAYIGEDNKFHYYESDESHEYSGEGGIGGFALRTQSLRIRAARIDNQPQVTE